MIRASERPSVTATGLWTVGGLQRAYVFFNYNIVTRVSFLFDLGCMMLSLHCLKGHCHLQR